MEINNWFGPRKMVTQTNETAKAFEHLLCLYANAISKYFGLENVGSAVDLINVARGNNLKKGDILLVDWFEGKALPIISEYMNQKLPESSLLVSQLKYEYFILEQEMGISDTGDMRACLVDIINDLPDRIREAKGSENVSSGFDYTDSYKTRAYNFIEEHPIISFADSSWTNIEGISKSLSNNKGSAMIAGPLLFDKYLEGN